MLGFPSVRAAALRLAFVVLWLVGLTAIGWAQAGVTLEFDSAAPRDVFVALALPKQPPTNVTKSGGKTLVYRPTSTGPSDRIYVWDHTTNNLASKPIKDIVGSVWQVKSSDYTLIGSFVVHVEHKGEPLSAAHVTVSAKGKSEQKLLAPNEKGDVEFFGFPVGELRVKVTYVTSDKKDASRGEIFPIAISRDTAEPVLDVAIPEGVATVAETASPRSTADPGRTQESGGGSSVGKLILMLVALLVIGGVAYWAFFMFKNKPDQVKDTLTKLGVQIPQPHDPNGGAPAAVQPLAPAPPPPKIMLEDAAPTPLADRPRGPSGSPVIGSTLGGALVRESGERTPIPEGETVVGRDPGLGLSLTGESSISRRHASLTRAGTMVVLTDLGSTNGTFVNGVRLQGEATLKAGDQIQFGSVRFRYEG